jgi:hypothetical protein
VPLTLVDYPVLRGTSTALAADPESYLITFPVVPQGYIWRVDQVSVMAVPGSSGLGFAHAPYVLLYDQPPGPLVVPIQGTQTQPWEVSSYATTPATESSVYADFDDQGSPLTVLGGDGLIVAWEEGIPDGTVLLARIQYGSYQGTPGQPTPVAGAVSAPTVPITI